MQHALKRWNQFWFEGNPYFTLSVFRLCLGFFIFLNFIYHLNHYSLRFTSEGLFDLELLQFYIQNQHHYLLEFIQEKYLGLAYGGLLVFSILMTFGIGGRLSLLGCFLCHAYLWQSSPLTATGPDRIIPFCLLYLMLTESNHYFSLSKNWSWNFWKPQDIVKRISQDLSQVGFRLMQIQICIVYFFAFVQKMRDPSWFSGEALWMIFQNTQLVSPAWQWLLQAPLFLAAMTYAVLLFEAYFPICVWFKQTRTISLWSGALFHLMATVFFAIPFFSIGMLICYLFFIPTETLEHWVLKKQNQIFSTAK